MSISADVSPIDLTCPKPFHWAWWIVYVALALLPMVWAGDTSFISDEPILLEKALIANAENRWEVSGLSGTVGRVYGPLPTWIYQVGLRITSDPIALIQLRAVTVMAIMLAGCAWIAWLIGAGGEWVLLIGLSPYILFYSRVLWDNSFNIPLTAIATAGALHVVIRRSLWPLPLVAAVLGAMLLIHLMSLALGGGIALFLLIYGRQALAGKKTWQYAATVGGVVLVAVIGWGISAGYREVALNGEPVPFVVAPAPNGWWFALFLPRLISAVWLNYYYSTDYLKAMPWAHVLSIAQIVSAGVFLLAWAGIPLTILGLFRKPRDITTIGGVLALCIVIAQIVLNGYTHTFGHPHYFNATWTAGAILVAVTAIHLSQPPRFQFLGKGLVLALAASLGISTVLIAQRIHSTGGSRLPTYGSTIANQLTIAHTFRQYDPHTQVHFEASVVPTSIQSLLWWTQQDDPPPAERPRRELVLHYTHPEDPMDGHMELVESSK